ncbi:TetR/AcrR family transcriptional regulator [Nocardioides sp.]|uniref:TetR/AcrR family transcriptional regulator n=1 Tax=Nocardioides sp. TaxID=35761 RepID=UPI002ED2B4CA
MSNEDRRRLMVEAALTVMLRKGIAATTARDVAAEMESSPGLIHHYFDSMDELVAAAFEEVATRGIEVLREAVSRESEPTGRLSEFFRSYLRDDRDWAFQLWLDAWADANRSPTLQAASRRLNLEWQQLLAELIAEGVAAGTFTCPDVPAAAWRILSILDGLTLQAVAHGEPFDRAWVLPWSAGVAERELGLPPGAIDLKDVESPVNH